MIKNKLPDTSDEEVSLMMMDLFSVLTIVGVIMSVAMAVIMDIIPTPTGKLHYVVGNVRSVFGNSELFDVASNIRQDRYLDVNMSFSNVIEPEKGSYRYSRDEDYTNKIPLTETWSFRPQYYVNVSYSSDNGRYSFYRLYYGGLDSLGYTISSKVIFLVNAKLDVQTSSETVSQITVQDTLEVFYTFKLFRYYESDDKFIIGYFLSQVFFIQTDADTKKTEAGAITLKENYGEAILKDFGFQIIPTNS